MEEGKGHPYAEGDRNSFWIPVFDESRNREGRRKRLLFRFNPVKGLIEIKGEGGIVTLSLAEIVEKFFHLDSDL